jgi:hypothetical protein
MDVSPELFTKKEIMKPSSHIQFLRSPRDHGQSSSTIPFDCTLDDLYNHPHCPKIIKESLEKHVSWQTRCETDIKRALRAGGRLLAFRAALTVYGYEILPDESGIELNITNAGTAASYVRPTPTHIPIVAAFVKLSANQGSINDLSIALTGIEQRAFTTLDTTSLLQLHADVEVLMGPVKQLLAEYPGFTDFNGSAEYRLAIAKVAIERALQTCLEEAIND